MTGIGGPQAALAGATLTVDLDAVARNWKVLAARLPDGAHCAAVVKADAYGLGADAVARTLYAAGCRVFFVAHGFEGLALRPALPADAEVAVLHGPMPGGARPLAEAGLTAVLNTPGQVAEWRAVAARIGRAVPAIVHVDTGMTRLALPPSALDALLDDPDGFEGIALRAAMSHLACADDPVHPMNTDQPARFSAQLARLRARFPGLPGSLANSGGILLGTPFHFDLARPGIALFGGNPVPSQPSPLMPTAHLVAPIVQVQSVDRPQTVGYSAAYAVEGPGRIATVAVGYADGFLRSLSGRAIGVLAGVAVPLAGRVSMDLLTFDVSAVPEHEAVPGAEIRLLGAAPVDVDAVAEAAGTIPYEILTGLSRRYHRVYRGGAL